MTAVSFKEYRARKILNIHKHVDGPWFWDKYSAHPHIGCRHGCEFCYARGGKYMGRRDPEAFDSEIKIKTNAAELLFLKTYELEIEGAVGTRIWAYRRAAWTVDEWPESIEEIRRREGTAGLQKPPGIGQRLAGLIGTWLLAKPGGHL